jgi:hypothetical protein
MTDSKAFSWQAAYRLAALETDRTRMATRIDAALLAINGRLYNPVDGPEHKEIEEALKALAFLRAEHADGSA